MRCGQEQVRVRVRAVLPVLPCYPIMLIFYHIIPWHIFTCFTCRYPYQYIFMIPDKNLARCYVICIIRNTRITLLCKSYNRLCYLCYPVTLICLSKIAYTIILPYCSCPYHPVIKVFWANFTIMIFQCFHLLPMLSCYPLASIFVCLFYKMCYTCTCCNQVKKLLFSWMTVM